MFHTPTSDRFNRRDKGFTLIEILVVVIIIGVLAAIAIPVFLNQRKKGVDASMKSDLRSAAIAADTFAADNPGGGYGSITLQMFTDAGYKKTTGNTIMFRGDPQNGYCMRAENPRGSTVTFAPVKYFYYDSKLGGLPEGGPQASLPGGVCANQGILAPAFALP